MTVEFSDFRSEFQSEKEMTGILKDFRSEFQSEKSNWQQNI